ncbi:MAG TPA: asparaginase [Planctomycetota bacterium]
MTVPTMPSAALAAELAKGNPVLAVTTRSGAIESWHRGAVAVWHADERVLGVGDVERPVFARSATKPFQALPFLERGLGEAMAVPVEETAVMCASHDGAAVHTAAVRSLLARGGLGEHQLGCGPQVPRDAESRLELVRRGEKPGRVHHNCSGKHAGFLHLAHACGDDLANYLDPRCRSQQEVAAAVASMAGLPAPAEVGLDGCGAPTFRLPLSALARAFCRLANPDGLGAVRAAACRTILDAAGRAPLLLAGERRFCTALLRCWPGRVFAKNGAEGVYCAALAPDPRRRRWPAAIGIAVKIDDGNERGYQPVVVDLLAALGAFDGGEVPAPTRPFHRLAIQNSQQKPTGDVQCVVSWPLA